MDRIVHDHVSPEHGTSVGATWLKHAFESRLIRIRFSYDSSNRTNDCSNRTKFDRTSLVDSRLANGSRSVFYIWQVVPIVGTSKSINLDL